jgi:hypothetical protein
MTLIWLHPAGERPFLLGLGVLFEIWKAVGFAKKWWDYMMFKQTLKGSNSLISLHFLNFFC